MDGQVNLLYGTYASYKALGEYDENTLYFVDGVIYKGETLYSEKVEKVEALPGDDQRQGVIYVTNDYSFQYWDGEQWQTLLTGTIGTIADSSDANDGKLVTAAAVRTYVTAKIAALGDLSGIDDKIDTAKTEAVTTAKGYTDEVKQELSQKLSSVFHFKGSKEDYSELEEVGDAVTGDVWHLNDSGKEYVYTDSSEWEPLGIDVDLSKYSTTEDMNQAIDTKVAAAIAAIDTYYKKAEVDSKISDVEQKITTHEEDDTVHVTAAEKAKWEAKVDQTAVDTAKQAAIDTAKQYTDTKDTAMGLRVTALETAITWQTL